MAARGGFRDLRVYQLAYKLAMQIFKETKTFPLGERYSMTSQIRRCSRSVAANLAEGYRKRQYPSMFVSKLADFDGEATETRCGWNLRGTPVYLSEERAQRTGGCLRGTGQNAMPDDRKSGKIRAHLESSRQ
jgi:four helix bundle protein